MDRGRLRRILALAFGGAVALLRVSSGLAQSAAGPQSGVAHATEIIELSMSRTLAPGAQIAVSRGGRLVWSRSFGCADVELDVPVGPETRLRIGSVSKPLTAAAIGLLVQEGKLDLDVPIQKYVPDFPKKAWPITTRQLAGHLAGIRHYEKGEFEIRDHYDTVRAGLVIFEKDALLFEPGTRFSYSSYGWNLISAVLEAASGEPFLELMTRRVFQPAGMTHTTADQPAPIIPGRARFYTRTESGIVENAGYVDNSYKWAGGGFLSTAEDLALFGSALLQPGFLKPESLRQLFTSQKTSDGKDTGYGIGWFVGKSKSGQKVYAHDGGAVGGSSRLLLYPDAHMVVAMICNFEGGWQADEVESVGEAFEAK